MRTRSRLVLLAALLAPALGCGKIMTFLKGGPHDAGPELPPELVDEPIATTPRDASIDHAELLKLLGVSDDDEAEDPDAGCPQPIHPGYCRRRCRSWGQRSASGHASRVYPSAAYAFGTCGGYDVFAEKGPDGGGITEYYDHATSELVGARDDRQACGRYGTIPSCTPSLVWKDGGIGHRRPTVTGGAPLIE